MLSQPAHFSITDPGYAKSPRQNLWDSCIRLFTGEMTILACKQWQNSTEYIVTVQLLLLLLLLLPPVVPPVFTCDNIYAIAHICHTNSICPSVACVICIKTAEHIIEILSRSDRTIILVFRHQRSLRRSDGFTPNRGAEYNGR